MTGNTFSREDILAHLEQTAMARSWPEEATAKLFELFPQLPGWGEWVDVDGQPDPEWFEAAAALMIRTALPGAEKMAEFYLSRAGIQVDQAHRDLWNSLPAMPAQWAASNTEDLLGVLQTVGNTTMAGITATGTLADRVAKNPTPVLVGLGLAAGLALLFAFRR